MDNFIITRTGKKVSFSNPKPETICLEDIAWALSNTCRFGGHSGFYSVAEHSIHMTKLFHNPHSQMWALMHDATEAYVGDMTSPLKRELPQYESIERRFKTAISIRFQLNPFEQPPLIKVMDNIACSTEAIHFFGDIIKKDGWWDKELVATDKFKPECLEPMEAFEAFLIQYDRIEDRMHLATNPASKQFPCNFCGVAEGGQHEPGCEIIQTEQTHV
jgi:5'-deoxynucleotidase YfbR-like HD superfamily hydrolase